MEEIYYELVEAGANQGGVGMTDPLSIEDTRRLIENLNRQEEEQRERDEKVEKDSERWEVGCERR